jgi:hypothetical protein
MKKRFLKKDGSKFYVAITLSAALMVSNSYALLVYPSNISILCEDRMCGAKFAPNMLSEDVMNNLNHMSNNAKQVYNSSVALVLQSAIEGKADAIARAAGTIIVVHDQKQKSKYLLITAGHNLSADPMVGTTYRKDIKPSVQYGSAPLPNITIVSAHQIKNILAECEKKYGKDCAENAPHMQSWALEYAGKGQLFQNDLTTIYKKLVVTIPSEQLKDRAFGSYQSYGDKPEGNTTLDIAVFQLTQEEVAVLYGTKPNNIALLSYPQNIDQAQWRDDTQRYVQSGFSNWNLQIGIFSPPNRFTQESYNNQVGFTYVKPTDADDLITTVNDAMTNGQYNMLAYRNANIVGANYTRIRGERGDSGGGLFRCGNDIISSCDLVAVDSGIVDLLRYNGGGLLASVLYTPISAAESYITKALQVKP